MNKNSFFNSEREQKNNTFCPFGLLDCFVLISTLEAKAEWCLLLTKFVQQGILTAMSESADTQLGIFKRT